MIVLVVHQSNLQQSDLLALVHQDAPTTIPGNRIAVAEVVIRCTSDPLPIQAHRSCHEGLWIEIETIIANRVVV